MATVISATRRDRRRRFGRLTLGLVLFVAGMALVPHRFCARGARAWYDGDPAAQERLARGVERHVTAAQGEDTFATGSAKYNGEWLLVTHMMAGLGFGQTALEHPEWRDRHVALMSLCIERMLSPEMRRFDQQAWGEDALETLAGEAGHAGYLGYFNLLLSFHRALDPGSKHADLNDRITAALARRIEQSRTLLLETYPGEVYPADNSTVVASIALHDRATGGDHGPLLARWVERLRRDYTEPRTGLLYQAVHAATGEPRDAPRGSGTCVAQYFLSFMDPALSRDLDDAVAAHLYREVLGFGLVREYPTSVEGGGDIDSGPVVFGFGASATGFCLAGSRQHRHEDRFSRIYSTAYLLGAPLDHGDEHHFVSGGPLGDAILFAMLTAQPARRSDP